MPFCRCLIALVLLVGGYSASADIRIRDDAGQEIRLAAPARRIVSLAPHVTETLFAAGAGDRIVGTVEFSNYPEAAKSIPRVGGYERVDLEAVLTLKPDLVVGWQSGNSQAHLDKLRKFGLPVYLTQSNHIDDIAPTLEHLGEMAGTSPVARVAAKAYRDRLATLRARFGSRPVVRTFYQVWHQPLMTVGGKQIISDAIRLCGGENVFDHLGSMAAAISEEAVIAADPEVIIASGMNEARPDWVDNWRRWKTLTAVIRDNLFFIPPDLIQRHTPRLLDGAEMLCNHLEKARTRRK
ncbi:cobalamin-binding protein [bacterium]|nr:cobalamin-binding protein [bacterium]